ncbi:MAG TPA: hypothetical protein VF290_11590 [Pyrinomonadaceae bacterium]
MVQSLPSTHIEAHVGNVSGGSQVAIGNYIVQIGRVEGGVVNILNEAPPPPRLRPQPVLLRPKPFPNLLDRQTETTTLVEALTSQQPVECTGVPGAGRTSLLRHLAHQPQLATAFPAGVIYFEVNKQSASDLLKSIFDAFYICDFPIKPNETEIRHYLQPVSALVLLDDVEIDAKQIQSLMNVAPNCTFVAVTRERILLGEAVDVTLEGLPVADAVRLYQNELRRTLSAEEVKGAQTICESVACIPLLVLRAAQEARGQNSISENEKKVLAALAVFSGAPVAAEHVAAVAGVTSVEPLLEDLERRGLVQSHEQRYQLASDVKTQQLGNMKPWFARAVVHLIDWTKERRNRHKLIAGSAAAILLVLKRAVAAEAWNEVRSLGHAVEEALTVNGQWDMWATVLNSINKAARAQGDIAEQAWVLHQLGTRALLLGDRAGAEASLTDALDIRERLNDVSGAAVTRHNLNILLAPLPPETHDNNSSNGAGGNVASTPAWVKIGVVSLFGVAILMALLIWYFWPTPQPPVSPPKIASFSVSPSAIPANGQVQLCYEVENADSVRIDPNIGERKPASKECLSVTPTETLTYTLTAFAADGQSTSRQITLNVEPAPPPQVEIVRFEVRRQNGPGGPADVQFRLCYELRNAAHAVIDNNGGNVVLNRPNCQQITPQQTTTYTLSATGQDGRTVTRQATADATKPPVPRPQILSFTASPERVVDDGTSQLCFRLKDASNAQLDPGARTFADTQDQCVTVRPLQTTTYTLKAFNSEGAETKNSLSVTVVRTPKHARILFFDALSTRIKRGEPARLCYGVADANTTTISPLRREFPSVDKHCFEHAPRESTTYVLKATGEDNQTESRELSVVVESPAAPPPPPPVRITRFEINPTIVHGTQLCYALENARSARIEPGIGTLQNLTADCPRLPSRREETYTLTAIGEDGKTATRQVTYTPPPKPQLPAMRIVSFTPLRQTMKAGGEARICYRTTAGEGTAQISPQPGIVPPAVFKANCVRVVPQQTTEYTLTVGRGNEKESRKVTVIVDQGGVIF